LEAENGGDHFDQPRVQSGHQRRQEGGAPGTGLYCRGPVFITDRGRPAHVLLTIEDYQRLADGNMSLAEALAQPGDSEFAFKPPRVGGGLFKPADLG
jgi:hypothetical protein